MTHASLFSGIGGFDLAARWAGFENLFNCEIDPFCQRILNYHFPDAKQYSDIKSTDFTLWAGRVDILSGGFPCQPFSLAGKRKGTSDDRHLWPQMLRALREIKPRWVVGENVLGILSWDKGVVFEQVCLDLEVEGYEVQPFILPACGVDAPHQRYRVWFVAHRTNAGAQGVQGWPDGVLSNGNVAYPDSTGFQTPRSEQPTAGVTGVCTQTFTYTEIQQSQQSSPNANSDRLGLGANEQITESECSREADAGIVRNDGVTANTHRKRCSELDDPTVANQARQSRWGLPTWDASNPSSLLLQGCKDRPRQIELGRGCDGIIPGWADFPTQAPICSRNDGLSAKLDGITFPKWRAESIKGFGNAIVPQVALQIFEAIKQ